MTEREGAGQAQRILFLDDSEERTIAMQKVYPEAVCVQTAAECIEKLSADVWHVLCLDHDLGGEVFVDSGRPDCGMEVVRWMVRNRPIVGRVIVHTWNEPAGRRMVDELRRKSYAAIFAPFATPEWGGVRP